MYDLGLRLKEVRIRKKLTQKQVADRISLDTSTISGYENNIKTPSLEVLIKLALLYNVSSDYLLGIDNRPMIYVDGLAQKQVDIINDLLEEFKKK